ncbi:MAG: RNA polymerase sigma-70 factor [Bacteroidetes bacterium]|nr:RNA polymerase sigma-70 factor [Bacteroidota bacterium]
MSPIAYILFILLAAMPDKARKALYVRIKEGDHQAFKSFYDQHYDGLCRYLTSKNIRQEDAEDLIQKAFIYIWENREKINPDQSLQSYLFRIAYTRMINHVKKNSKFNDEIPENEPSRFHSPEEELEFSELNNRLEQAVEEMPEKRKAVFTSCFIKERTYKETATILDVSIKTVENHMALALRDVRKAVQLFRTEKNQPG